MKHMNERWIVRRVGDGLYATSESGFLVFRASVDLPDDPTGERTAQAICDAHNAALDAALAPKADAPASVAPVGAAGCVPAGLTVRQWYAGQALAGMLANERAHGGYDDFANNSFKYADAMLAAEKGGAE